MKKAVLFIDWREDWRDKSYEYYLGEFREEIASAKKALEHCRKKKIPAVFTQHGMASWVLISFPRPISHSGPRAS